MTKLECLARVAVDKVSDAQGDVDDLVIELVRLSQAIEHFAAEVEEARSYHENKGGMRVPFHGDFGQCPPSTLNRLAWHVRNMKGSEG